ncbi:MAG: sigma-54-dependent Fis family transcriptional regulator [Deltaproteobacteria bacterium]|nr:MAG: sigma-54-dependent Fis family transcriptional regulator [Deltaproteobacteria bacterium]
MRKAMSTHILIADDDEVSCQLFAETLESDGFRVDQVTSGDTALSSLDGEPYDLLVIDVRMPGMSGLDVTRIVHEKYPALPIIVMTAFGSIETAVEAIHEGAFDFISKPMNLAELKNIVSRALAQRSLQRRVEKTAAPDGEYPSQLGKIIGKSPPMLEVYKTVARVAPTKTRHTRTQPPRQRSVRRRGLWRLDGNASRKRTLRPHARFVHGSGRG